MEILLTGFPGFIAEHLLRYAATQPAFASQRWNLAVHPSMVSKAHEILGRLSFLGERCHVFAADITRADLGLSPEQAQELKKRVEVIFHLAAFYDLAGAYEPSYKVNVEGTRNVVTFARGCSQLKKINYVSTCFVAGICEGLIREDDLASGQSFYNHYESTKHQAEAEFRVQTGFTKTAIFRPAVVVGDSRTGEAAKYDGPMIFVRFLQQWKPVLRCLPLMPNLGLENTYVNTVPVDIVVRTLYHGGVDLDATGCFQLADASVPTTDGLYRFLVQKVLGRGTFPLPRFLRVAILKLLGLFPFTLLTGMPRTTLDYFFYRGRFDTRNFERLCQRHGITVPRFTEVFPALIAFAQKNVRPFPNQMLELRFKRWRKLLPFLIGAGLLAAWWNHYFLLFLALLWGVETLFAFRIRQSRGT